MIPKIIHYCWFGGNNIPGNVQKYIKSWETKCPDYKIQLWNEDNYDISCHPFIKAAYDAKVWAFVSDYVRLDVVYRFGGIYLDTDVELLKNLDPLLDNSCYLGIEQHGLRCNTGLGFGAESANPVVAKMLDVYDYIVFEKNKLYEIECPVLNDSVIRTIGDVSNDDITYLDGVTVFPAKYFDPISTGKTQNLLCEDTYSIHHYAASWTSASSRLKRSLITFLGEENYFKIKKLFRRTM